MDFYQRGRHRSTQHRGANSTQNQGDHSVQSRANRSTQSQNDTPSQSQTPSGSNVPESMTSATPVMMTMEDFVSQPGRELLTPLDPRKEGRHTWFGSTKNGISKAVLKMMEELLSIPYPTYSRMPREEADMWFKQFAQEFTWEKTLTLTVRREFDAEVARLYSKRLNEWKQRWRKGKRPKRIADSVYDGLITYWGLPETEKTSTTNSKNRRSDRGGLGMATHNAGAMSYITKDEQLTQKNGGVPVDRATFIETVHTKKSTNEIQDPVAKAIVENSRKRAMEYAQSQPEYDASVSISSNDIPVHIMNKIVEEEAPKSKGRIFGFGNLTQYSDSTSCSSRSYNNDPILQEVLLEKEARIEILEKLRVEDKAETKRLAEEIERKHAQDKAEWEKKMAEENKRRDEQMAAFMEEMRAMRPPNP